MPKKAPLILLVILVLVPLVALAIFGFQLQLRENEQLENQFSQLAKNELNTVERDIQSVLQGVEKRLTVYVADFYHQLNKNQGQSLAFTEYVRAIIHKESFVQQVYVASNAESSIFPPDVDKTANEVKFLTRTQRLWKDLMIQADNKEIKNESPYLNRSFFSSAASSLNPEFEHWKPWYSEGGIGFILFFYEKGKPFIAFELSGMRLMSEIIARLPSSNKTNSISGSATIRLLDERNTVIYQWGGSASDNGGEIKSQDQPLRVEYLHNPLGSWHLDYYAAPSVSRVTQTLHWILIVFILSVLVIVVAVLFYNAQQRAYKLAMQRVNFVNQVSHELKTPLTNVRMYAELLEERLSGIEWEGDGDGDGKEEETKALRYMNVISSESQRLSRLIENVLSFSRFQNNKQKINCRTCDINKILKDVVDRMAPLLEIKGLEIVFQTESALNAGGEKVYCDPEAIEQIITNLLGNAEKYAENGHQVTIQSEVKDGVCKVVISDDGPGIPYSMRQKVFMPFFRISSKLTDGVSGTGIGLGIARDLARLQGGDLVLNKSEAGASFTLTLTSYKG